MPSPETSSETPRDPIHITEENAISIEQALQIARAEDVQLGKSTLQRWALKWKEQHEQSPVKSVQWIAGGIKTYFLDREDFKAWLFERKQNMGPHLILRDPAGSHETLQDLKRPQETSRGPQRPREDSGNDEDSETIQKLRDENINLKIDVEVRKRLLSQAGGEMTRQREQIEGLLRENGALQSQLLQLSVPAKQERQELPPPPAEHIYETEPIHYSQDSIDNSTAAAGGAL